MKRLFKNSVIVILLSGMAIYLTSCKKEATLPVVRIISITDVTQTTASFGGNVTDDGGAEIMEMGVCWDTSPNPTTNSNKTSNGKGTGLFNGSLTGLTANTKYYVRAYATNSAGTGYGKEISFITDQVIEPPKVPTLITIVVTSITFRSAASGGIITDNGGEDVTEMGVCWGTNANPTTDNNKISNGPGNSYFSVWIDKLKPATEYFVRAYATNSVGTTYGNEWKFATLPIGPIVFNPDLTYGSVTDIDGNIYKTIQIGTQIWMAENLKTIRYNDGTTIPYVPGDWDYSDLAAHGYSWYDDDAASYKETFGALYNWYAVSTGKLCPSGWHVPIDSEYQTLTGYLGNDHGVKMIETVHTHWFDTTLGGTNESGFTGLPGGYRYYESNWGPEVDFSGIGYAGSWWLATEKETLGSAYFISWDEFLYLSQFPRNKLYCMSVRCVKD